MKLTCITPVHIGNGISYNSGEYIYVPSNKGGQIYFLNESGWLKYLYEKKIIDLFAKDLLEHIHKGIPFNIYEWLATQKTLGSVSTILSELEEENAVYSKENVYLDFNRRTQKLSLNDVHPFIRAGNGSCYIPGSSIKGAFRTALLVQDIMQHPAKYKTYWQEAEQVLFSRGIGRNPIENRLKRIAENIEAEFSYPKERIREAKEANVKKQRVAIVNDIFKYLQISDAVACAPLKLAVVQKVDLGITAAENDDPPKTMPICRECIMPDNSLEFTVSVDDEALKQIGASHVNNILSALQDFTALQYDLQADVYGNAASCELNQLDVANLVLGGGTGYFSKTILYALADSQAKNREEGRLAGVHIVRAFMKEKFYRGHHERDSKLSPHTLKLTRYQNKTVLMGLCKVEVKQELC